jgi:putative sigma-54 modulation protein
MVSAEASAFRQGVVVMQIKITGPNLSLTEAIKRHVHDRLTAALDQYAQHVTSAEVVLTDENGPKEGRDMTCQIWVQCHRGRSLIIKRRGEDLYANVSLAADKTKRRVGQHVKRLKDKGSSTIRGKAPQTEPSSPMPWDGNTK